MKTIEVTVVFCAIYSFYFSINIHKQKTFFNKKYLKMEKGKSTCCTNKNCTCPPHNCKCD